MPIFRPTQLNLALAILCGCSFLAGLPQTAPGQQELRKVQRSYNDQILPLLKEHCFDCHSGGDPDAGFNLEGFETLDQLLNARKKWKKVLVRVAAKEMPPSDSDPIPEVQHKILMDWLDNLLNSVDCTTIEPGRVTIRKLNRTEYRNTIRDLLGVDYRPAQDFPGDDVGYGFDNIADVISLPPILMEKYLQAAEEITRQAVIDPQSADRNYTILPSDFRTNHGSQVDGNSVAMTSNGTILGIVKVEETARYNLTIRASGTPAENEWPKLVLEVNDRVVGKATVDAHQDSAEEFAFSARLKKGENRVAITFTNDLYIPRKEDRNLFIDQVMISGPFFPPTKFQRELLPRKPKSKKEELEFARRALNQFSSFAYRRRATTAELDRMIALFESARSAGDSFEGSIRYSLQAILVSPYFLYKVERPTSPGKTRLLTDFELATSLSYFLWSSMPDKELFQIANDRQLRSKKNYLEQIDRMLQDPRSDALVENFVAQWLQLGHLEHIKPDPDLFPGVDEALLADMAKETKMLVADLIRRDASIFELLKTDYSFVNGRLAEHYGIEGVRGEKFRKTSLKSIGRVGLMSQASILTLTSNPNRTSPVKRGKWIMENLLGEEPPPPDPDAMQLEDQQELTGTLRERMEQHRADPNCAVCHRVMDELGFALENYDGVGRWRDKDESHPVDARGELPDGTKFEGAGQLQRIVESKMRDQFVRCVVEKMLIYALGRGLEYFDECTVDKIIDEIKAEDYRFSALIRSVAMSRPFVQRQGPPVITEEQP